MALQQYPMRVIYQKGQHMRVADAISRLPTFEELVTQMLELRIAEEMQKQDLR